MKTSIAVIAVIAAVLAVGIVGMINVNTSTGMQALASNYCRCDIQFNDPTGIDRPNPPEQMLRVRSPMTVEECTNRCQIHFGRRADVVGTPVRQ